MLYSYKYICISLDFRFFFPIKSSFTQEAIQAYLEIKNHTVFIMEVNCNEI